MVFFLANINHTSLSSVLPKLNTIGLILGTMMKTELGKIQIQVKKQTPEM
jgi:hypothetical protein